MSLLKAYLLTVLAVLAVFAAVPLKTSLLDVDDPDRSALCASLLLCRDSAP